tara:strand:- start:729 stop:1520 length:792 start_codon:yes stop_codon:yes gene_type:complete
LIHIKSIIISIFLFLTLTLNVTALVIGSDEEEILIDANFAGQDLLVFGAFYGDPSQPRDEKGDLLIEIVGPSEDVMLRKKKSFVGFWLNAYQVEFRDIPGFYYLSSTSEIDKEFLNQNNIGILKAKRSSEIDWSSLTINWGGVNSYSDKKEFNKALVRTKTQENLYKETSNEIEILDGNLFKSSIHIPNTVPVGKYDVNVYLIIGEKITKQYSYQFTVTRIGIEEAIYNFAFDFPLLYGLVSLAIAAITGWSGAELFRRFRKS